MSRLHIHPESHLVSRIGWQQAAVFGASDGIVSTASLIVGVAAASAATSVVLAGGEYVSVSSQSDTEQTDLARARAELATQPEFERKELARIYIDRGVSPDLAYQWMAKDALGAHVRDELGISEVTAARPIQAALTSAATFAVGAGMPLAMVLLMPRSMLVVGVSVASLLLPFPPWCRGRAGGWCQCDESHPAGDLLGRARDGADGRDRRGVWNGCRVMWMVLHIPQSTRGAPDDHCRA